MADPIACLDSLSPPPAAVAASLPALADVCAAPDDFLGKLDVGHST